MRIPVSIVHKFPDGKAWRRRLDPEPDFILEETYSASVHIFENPEGRYLVIQMTNASGFEHKMRRRGFHPLC